VTESVVVGRLAVAVQAIVEDLGLCESGVPFSMSRLWLFSYDEMNEAMQFGKFEKRTSLTCEMLLPIYCSFVTIYA
jgi:hypothetical protein